jgi:hypothetical protein
MIEKEENAKFEANPELKVLAIPADAETGMGVRTPKGLLEAGGSCSNFLLLFRS